ncbi:MAG: hypothetical protein HC894_27870 [Microcoleus sp. SM1_3_4]|nr:hypothetical protein [Microcoleus sp. SM1_3_4]
MSSFGILPIARSGVNINKIWELVLVIGNWELGIFGAYLCCYCPIALDELTELDIKARSPFC